MPFGKLHLFEYSILRNFISQNFCFKITIMLYHYASKLPLYLTYCIFQAEEKRDKSGAKYTSESWEMIHFLNFPLSRIQKNNQRTFSLPYQELYRLFLTKALSQNYLPRSSYCPERKNNQTTSKTQKSSSRFKESLFMAKFILSKVIRIHKYVVNIETAGK